MNKKILFFDKIFSKLYINEGGSTLINTGWGHTDLTIYKGVSSSVEFMILNHDRKPLFLRGRKVFIKFLDFYTREILLEKEMIVIDPEDGRVKVILTPDDVENWEDGHVKFIVTVVNVDDNYEFALYNDFSQGISGNLIVKSSHTPSVPSPQKLTGFLPVQHNIQTVYMSNPFKGPAQLGYSSSLVTVSIHLENFSGKIYTQASLEPILNRGDSGVWFNIQLTPGFDYLEYSSETSVQAFNVFGNYYYIRFYYIPDSSNEGKIEKILVL